MNASVKVNCVLGVCQVLDVRILGCRLQDVAPGPILIHELHVAHSCFKSIIGLASNSNTLNICLDLYVSKFLLSELLFFSPLKISLKSLALQLL